MAETFDVVIIGGGPGGYNCAIRAGQLGLKTAIIEMRDTLGGTCLNVGCIPSKALLHASELFDTAKNDFAGMGIKTGKLDLDLKAMMAQKDDAVKGLTEGVAFLMKKNKVTHFHGKGTITGPGAVEVLAQMVRPRNWPPRTLLLRQGLSRPACQASRLMKNVW